MECYLRGVGLFPVRETGVGSFSEMMCDLLSLGRSRKGDVGRDVQLGSGGFAPWSWPARLGESRPVIHSDVDFRLCSGFVILLFALRAERIRAICVL